MRGQASGTDEKKDGMSSAGDSTEQRNARDDAPFISVVVAVFNAAETLGRCLTSVSTQTYANRELVVIDGGSLDGTKEVIQAHVYCIAHWESERDRGIYHAWNKALKVIRGNWVYFLGADDYLADEHVLGRVASHLKGGSSGARVVYGRVELVRKDRSVIATLGSQWNRKEFFQLDDFAPSRGFSSSLAVRGARGI
ncbi:MAG: glycosyltransferase [Nitrospira sp.]